MHSSKWAVFAFVASAPACALIIDLPEGHDKSAAGGAGGSSGDSAAGGGGGVCKTPCDCDEDGVKSVACAGTDCADDDANVKPGQIIHFIDASSNPSIGFDFDCSGAAEREHDTPVKCLGLALVACDTKTQGFLETLPPCGQSGDWGTCKKGTVACEKDVVQSKPMACK